MRLLGIHRHHVALLLVACISLPLVIPRSAHAQRVPIRLSVNKWKVEPGDSYTLTWMESGTVQPMSDYVVEEDTDPQFKDRQNYSRYVVRAHRKAFENSAAFSHTVRYYRVRARAWVRNELDQQVEEEVVSNTVRVTLLGTDKSDAPSFPDDPEEPPKRPTKDKDDKKQEDEYPTMGRPDLTVQRLQIEPKEPKAGEKFKVRVTVRNAGVFPSASVQVRIEAAGRQYIVECEPLKPGYAADVVGPQISTATAGPTSVSATVDPFERVTESREDNNTRAGSFPIVEATPTEKSDNGAAANGGNNSGSGK